MEGTPCTKESTVAKSAHSADVGSEHLTWLVHTLLKATNANVCTSIVLAKSTFASSKGIANTARESCGIKASDSIRNPAFEPRSELKCSNVL